MMLLILAAVLLALPSNVFMAMAREYAQTQTLDAPATVTLGSLRDRYRPLLVFAPTERDERFLRQLSLFSAGSNEMQDRQVLFVPLPTEAEAHSACADAKGIDAARLTAADAADVRRRFHIMPREFTVILVGKDGGEKFRTHIPVTMGRLNALIDAMPMRQQEVHNGHPE